MDPLYSTYLYLWAFPVALLIMMALAESFRPSVRVIAVVLAVGTIWVAWAIHGIKWVGSWYGTVELAQFGLLGDMFGGLNALFAALAFGGVAIAAYLQFGTSRQTRIQTFEESFYSAIDLLHRIAEGLSFEEQALEGKFSQLDRMRRLAGIQSDSERKIFKGREVFPAVVASIARRADYPDMVFFYYRHLQENHNYVLGHYFRHLYQVLKLIDRQVAGTLSQSGKEGYASMLRAQLSTSELALLLINCTEGMVDGGQFRNLLVRYRMLEHLPLTSEKGVYRSRDSGLIVGSLETMQSFLTVSKIVSGTRASAGAFGNNPESVPKPLNLI